MTKKLDNVFEQFDSIKKEKAEKNKKMKPYLDKQLSKVEIIDNKIIQAEKVIDLLEKERQAELLKMNDLLDLAMKDSHSLSNGYKVIPDNRRKVKIINIIDFMKWLKDNKSTKEVLEFFSEAMKVTKLKTFCEKEANHQRMEGILEPSVGGVEFGDITFRRLTTKGRK